MEDEEYSSDHIDTDFHELLDDNDSNINDEDEIDDEDHDIDATTTVSPEPSVAVAAAADSSDLPAAAAAAASQPLPQQQQPQQQGYRKQLQRLAKTVPRLRQELTMGFTEWSAAYAYFTEAIMECIVVFLGRATRPEWNVEWDWDVMYALLRRYLYKTSMNRYRRFRLLK